MQYALIWQRVIVWLSDFVPIELILLLRNVFFLS